MTGAGETGNKLRILGLGLHTGTRVEEVGFLFRRHCNSGAVWPISVLREMRGTNVPQLTPRQRKTTMLEMGHRFGDYELLKKIGRGGMAEVWVGRRVVGVGKAAKYVAIKVMRVASALKTREHRLFVEETRLSMLLSHSNIVQVFDAGSQGERHYLVMEWVDGVDMAAIAQSYRDREVLLPDIVTAHCIAGVLQGLEYAHSITHNGGLVGVIHRDISPHNVLVSVSGEVKVTDFGIARQVLDETSGVHIKGKLRYMAPEQLLGETRGPSVDLYAVGVMLHEFLDGCRFRQGSRMDELQAVTRRGEIPPLRRDDVPAQLDTLRLGLLAPDPTARIRTATEALTILRQWPGFSEATAELAQIVRAHVGVSGPRVSDTEVAPNAPIFSNTHLMPMGPAMREGAALPAEPTPTGQTGSSPREPSSGVELGVQTQTEISDVLGTSQPMRVQLPRALWGAVAGLGCVLGYVLWLFARPGSMPVESQTSKDASVAPLPKVDVTPLDLPQGSTTSVDKDTEASDSDGSQSESDTHAEEQPAGLSTSTNAPVPNKLLKSDLRGSCGNRRCEPRRGENCHSCERDCLCGGGRTCTAWNGRYQCTAASTSLKE